MEDLTEEEMNEVEEKIVISRILRDFNKIKSRKSMKKRKRRTFKFNYWDTEWGRLIRSEFLGERKTSATSTNGESFRARFSFS